MSGRLDLNQQPLYRKVCSFCHRRVPASWNYDMCYDCLKREMFTDVAEYIRQNDVNEVEVAEHFGLDRKIIKDWIREGRLEHKRIYIPSDTDF